MKTYSLKGHERPLTFLKYNCEGDLLFSCAKDSLVTLWFSDTGRRVGTYRGHSGAIYQCDVTHDSARLLTASADSSLRIWEVKTGKELFKFQFGKPCRATALSLGEEMAVVTTDAFMGRPSSIHLIRIAREIEDQRGEDMLTISVDQQRITRAFFHDVNRQILTAHEDGSLKRWDVESAKCLQTTKLHEKAIQDLKYRTGDTQLITASTDKTTKLVDIDSFQTVRVYQTERPVNSADISPILEHIALGGGQDAATVTTTSARAGKFESVFFHQIFSKQFGTVRGHFGPINTVAFHPSGRSFSTGGEDGYLRLHHFDNNYFTVRC
jgi:translation initiation factor 3 subunit I